MVPPIPQRSFRKKSRSTHPFFSGFREAKKLNGMAEISQFQRLTKPLHYHCANPAPGRLVSDIDRHQQGRMFDVPTSPKAAHA